MISIKSNAAAFGQQIDKEIAVFEAMAIGVVRGLSITVFGILLDETPQWSGNAVANWNFGVGTPDLSVNHKFKDKLDKEAIPISALAEGAGAKGDLEAINDAIQRNAGRELEITANSTVYLTNNAENLSGASYIEMLELNPNNFLRPENEPGHMMATAVFEVSRAYANITTAKALELGAKTISGLSGNPTQLGLF